MEQGMGSDFKKIDLTSFRPDDAAWGSAVRVVRTLRDRGHPAFLVGGCVRNALLGLPSDDYDVATAARPDDVRALFQKTVDVGAKFGVIIVIDGDCQTQVATFRLDGAYEDKRHPADVSFSDARSDIMRRDFTINGLFMDPFTGEIVDYAGGMRDIEKGIVRCIGNPRDRFREDALRLLRAVRFAARFSFHIHPDTWDALVTMHEGIRQISAERIRDEILKILTGPHPGRALDLLETSGLLAIILPEVQALRGVPQPGEFHPEGDCMEHVRLALEALENPSPTLVMGTLLHDIGKPATIEHSDRIRFNHHDVVGEKIAEEVCTRLRLSNSEKTAVTDLVRRHMKFMHVREMRESVLRRFLSHPNISEDLAMHRADCLASHGHLGNYEFCLEKLKEYQAESGRVLPSRLLSGDDLITAGYKPGPQFSVMLQRAMDAQLEGLVTNREEALELIRREYPQIR